MANEKPVKIPQPATLDILSALVTESQWLRLIEDADPLQSELITLLRHFAAEPDYQRPAIKQLSSQLGKPAPAITRALQRLYQRIWELNDTQPELFEAPGYRYTFYFQDGYYDNNFYFTLWVEQPLHVGDAFNWYFARIRQNALGYYIEDIQHDFEKGKLVSSIYLRDGNYNSYRKHLLDKAMFLDLITIEERYRLKDFQLDELLKHRVVKDRADYPESLHYLRKKKWW